MISSPFIKKRLTKPKQSLRPNVVKDTTRNPLNQSLALEDKENLGVNQSVSVLGFGAQTGALSNADILWSVVGKTPPKTPSQVSVHRDDDILYDAVGVVLEKRKRLSLQLQSYVNEIKEQDQMISNVDNLKIVEEAINLNQPDDVNVNVDNDDVNVNVESENEPARSNHNFDLQGIKMKLISYLVQILNKGSYDELIELKGIGKVRALRIITSRNANYEYHDCHQLEDIGMGDKDIIKFIESNLMRALDIN